MIAGSAKLSAMRTSSSSCQANLARQARRAFTELPLHQNGVDPAAKLETDRGQNSTSRETERLVQADRGPLIAAPDDRDHLAISEFVTALDERRKERPPDPAPEFRGVDINRILKAEPVRRTHAVA